MLLTELSGITSTEGHGDGTPVLLARVPMRATSAGLARFVCEPAAAFALPSPFGQLGQWRVAGATLEFEIATAAVLPLARLTLVGPTAPIALGNTFTIQVFAEEMSPEAKGFLGGPFDLYFEQNYVSVPDFSAAEAIQPPYRDVGLLSGTLRENRIDELGGATVQTGHGNGTKVLYALINFKAEAVGETVFTTNAGESGLTLTTPVGQLPFERIDYGQPFIVDIRPNFTVNISGGNSSESNCYAGQIVDLTAKDPEPGWQFSHWSGDETSLSALDDVNEANTSLIVPTAAVELEAKYVLIDYSLTVNGGSGSASPVHIGDQLEISADPPAIGMTFDCWIGDVRYLANPNAATTTVTVETSDISVTAKYRNLLYNTEIINGTGSSNTAVYGQRLTIVANAAPLGHAFAGWVGNEEDLACLAARYAMTTTLTQPDRDVTLTASYLAVDYQLTVINGSGTTIANYNDVISIVADEAATGQAFSHWSGDIAYLDNPQAATTNVTMPANNVTLTAVYSQVPYTLLVVNGTGSGTYYYEDEVTITAVPPSGGTGFATWVGHVQTLQNETVTETILTMPAAHTAVVAVYGTYDIDTIDLHLKAGWNCIAVPFETANPLGTKDSKGNEISRIWHWEGRFVTPKDETGVISETIKPNIGYWIFVKEDCTISFTRWEKE